MKTKPVVQVTASLVSRKVERVVKSARVVTHTRVTPVMPLVVTSTTVCWTVPVAPVAQARAPVAAAAVAVAAAYSRVAVVRLAVRPMVRLAVGHLRVTALEVRAEVCTLLLPEYQLIDLPVDQVVLMCQPARVEETHSVVTPAMPLVVVSLTPLMMKLLPTTPPVSCIQPFTGHDH